MEMARYRIKKSDLGKYYPLDKLSSVRRKIANAYAKDGRPMEPFTGWSVCDLLNPQIVYVLEEDVAKGKNKSPFECAIGQVCMRYGSYGVIDDDAIWLLLFKRKKLIVRVGRTQGAELVMRAQDSGGLIPVGPIQLNPVPDSRRIRIRLRRLRNGKTKTGVAVANKKRTIKRTNVQKGPVPASLKRAVFGLGKISKAA